MPEEIIELTFDKHANSYNKGVRMGNWVEENAAYKKHRYQHISTYTAHYPPKPYSANSNDVIWDAIFTHEGTPLIPKIGYLDAITYFNNFSSLYDLSYNHFPKWLGEPLRRKFRPQLDIHEPRDEYLETFGNATNIGLLDYKREKWRDEKADPRMTAKSHYTDEFAAPDKESYKFKRFGIPYANSSILNPSNIQSTKIKFRDIPICAVTPNDKLVVVKQEPRCNPITWECPFNDRQRTRCIPPRK